MIHWCGELLFIQPNTVRGSEASHHTFAGNCKTFRFSLLNRSLHKTNNFLSARFTNTRVYCFIRIQNDLIINNQTRLLSPSLTPSFAQKAVKGDLFFFFFYNLSPPFIPNPGKSCSDVGACVRVCACVQTDLKVSSLSKLSAEALHHAVASPFNTGMSAKTHTQH